MIKLRTLLLCDHLYIILSIISVLYSFLMMNCLIPKSHYKINDTVINGYIHSYKIDGNKLSIMLYGKEKVIINYYFKSLEEKEAFDLKLGDYLDIKGAMNKPRTATVFNLFDYKKYLNHNHIFFLMTADKIGLAKHNTRFRYTIKQFISDHIEALPKSASYVKALVIGDDDGFSDEVNKSYQLNGISHLFAISGSHISFLAVIILLVLKRLKVEENKRYYAVILFLLFYMFLTDYAGSVVRAVAFFAILSINKMYYFNIKTINVLQLTLSIVLLFKPSLLYDVGFQFSFLISLYLILNQSFINKASNYFKQTLLISFIAFLVSIPICINNFFQINLLSPLINLFFVPFISFIIFPLSFLCLVLPFLDSILFFFIQFLEWFSVSLSHIEIGNLILAKPTFLISIIYYAIITIAIKGMTMKKYHCFSFLVIILFVHCNINWFNNNPYIVFLDVGQGDSVFVNLPRNKGNILIDTGGKLDFTEIWAKRNKEYKVGEDLIIPYLKSIGIRQLDYLILTHGDEDHMGESINIIKLFKVKKVLLNSGSLMKLEEKLIKILKEMHISYDFGKANDVIKIDKYSFYVLNPISNTNENDNSLVLYMNINNNKIMLTGDMSAKIEPKLINAYSNLKVDILKVGHHGSITSTSETLLDVLKPQYAVVQVGLKNHFNHPNPIVIDRLIKRKIKVLQTSINGSIKFVLGSNDVTIISPVT